MALKAGIVGLPNVGKSTLFNAITKQKILAANYPFATIEPNVGVVMVPDERMNNLKEKYKPNSFVPTTFEFTDIAGLVEGAASGEGLGNKFLSHIRQVDAICEVVRCFDDENITHVTGSVDPIRDIEIINVELMLSDIEVVENRISKIGKKGLQSKDKEILKEIELMNKIKTFLMQNIPVRNMELSEEEEFLLRPFNLLTHKKMIYVTNVNEEEFNNTDNIHVQKVKEFAAKEGSQVIKICAKIEAELSELEEEDRIMFLEDLGIEESGLDKLIKATYDLLGLSTYFTTGVEEVRAWTFQNGMKAPACAGIIHSDFEKGFIKAEVVSYDDLIRYGDEKSCKEAGRLRLEGKEYTMKDGDICVFRFNV